MIKCQIQNCWIRMTRLNEEEREMKRREEYTHKLNKNDITTKIWPMVDKSAKKWNGKFVNVKRRGREWSRNDHIIAAGKKKHQDYLDVATWALTITSTTSHLIHKTQKHTKHFPPELLHSARCENHSTDQKSLQYQIHDHNLISVASKILSLFMMFHAIKILLFNTF